MSQAAAPCGHHGDKKRQQTGKTDLLTRIFFACASLVS
jgi:hypothetical protein